jgi:sensor histidine kinase regulating citrate/malate metabolism
MLDKIVSYVENSPKKQLVIVLSLIVILLFGILMGLIGSSVMADDIRQQMSEKAKL